jgi:anaerobic selenocysteine-containing dehydrogenase
MTMAEGRGAESTLSSGDHWPHLKERWDSWIEINPETAKELGIGDGDLVWVESKAGRLQTKQGCSRTHPVHPYPLRTGHQAYGRWAKGRINPNALLIREYDHLGGFVSHYSTRVKVYKA